ncbi:MAG: GNAT family N-acetyltransferase [Candidatus Faecousia sp.]|nr:GNAT family N-acetyltransferase [Clostridiales bacterium]MDY6181725.1 GNAT family N-acetyltransferase [Candidatus Faecousia sp.]
MLTIREMLPGDADSKGYVHYTSWQETYPGLVASSYLSRMSLERCQEIAQRRPEGTLLAQLDGKTVGFSCYGTNPSGQQELFALYLLKEAQGLGIGRKLMDASIQRMDAKRPIYLWVLKGNAHAIGFYEHYGFRLNGIQQEIILGTPNTELRMILERPEPL